MKEAALIKIQAIAIVDLEVVITQDPVDGMSLLSDEHLTISQNQQRELGIYEYILRLIIADNKSN
jgi:hypothetical protein